MKEVVFIGTHIFIKLLSKKNNFENYLHAWMSKYECSESHKHISVPLIEKKNKRKWRRAFIYLYNLCILFIYSIFFFVSKNKTGNVFCLNQRIVKWKTSSYFDFIVYTYISWYCFVFLWFCLYLKIILILTLSKFQGWTLFLLLFFIRFPFEVKTFF